VWSPRSPFSFALIFSKPCHLGSTASGLKTLETYCLSRMKSTASGKVPKGWANWKIKAKEGYDRMVETYRRPKDMD